MLRFARVLTAAALLLPSTLAAQRLLHEDRLRPETEGESEYSRRRWRDGAYEIQARRPMAYGFYDSASALPAYYRISVTTEFRDGPDQGKYGLMFGRPDRESNAFVFEIAQNGMYRLNAAGEIAIPWRTSDAIRRGRGQINVLAAEVRGRDVTLFVNGQRLERMTASRFLDGFCGVELDQDFVIRFRDYRIELLPVPEPLPGSMDVDALSRATEYNDEWGVARREGIALLVTARRSHARNYWTAGWLPPRVRVEATWTRIAGPTESHTSLVFGRAARSRTSTLLNVYGDGTYAVVSNRQRIIQRQPHPAIRTGYGVRNDLAVDVRGPRVWFYVNGQLVNQYTFMEDVVGYIGTEIGENLTARLEVLRVTTLPPGDLPLATPVTGGKTP